MEKDVNKDIINKVILDKETGVLTIYFDDPEKESYCSEFGDEDAVIMKDKSGRPIGIQFLNYFKVEKTTAA